MRWGLLGVGFVLLVGCSSGGGGGSGSTAPATTTAPTTTSAAPDPMPEISLSANWRLIRQHMKKDFDAICLLSYACSAHDEILGANISTSFVNVKGANAITVKYVEPRAVDVTGAGLVLGSFARYFSTDTGSQFDFSAAVSDALDALPVGQSRTTEFPPGEIVVQHPTGKSWQFTVQAVGS